MFHIKILITIFILSIIISCEKQEENILLGGIWISDNPIMEKLQKNHKKITLEFHENSMSIDKKKIPVIYKNKDNQILVFSRGDRIVGNLNKDGKIVTFLPGVGKTVYKRENK